jgi:hypothetical protein
MTKEMELLKEKLLGTYAVLGDDNKTVAYLLVRMSGERHVKVSSVYPGGEFSNGWIYPLLTEGEVILHDLNKKGTVKVSDNTLNVFNLIEEEVKK